MPKHKPKTKSRRSLITSFYFQYPAVLQWWAVGGYELVCHELTVREPTRNWSFPHGRRRAYRRVHAAINKMYKQTGDPRWHPIGHDAHEKLRDQIRRDTLREHDLI